EKPEKLKAFNISMHSFSLHWILPSGRVERYHVDLVPDSGFVTIKDLGGGEYQVDVLNGVPGPRYEVTISSISATTFSSPVSRTVTANVTKPGPPVFLAGERVGSAGILLSWNTPPNPNGKIISYIVKYKEVCPWMQTVYTQVRAKPDSLEVLLTNLNPGTTYEIKVAAENSAGIGVFSDPFLFQTAESAPGKVVNLTVEAFNYSAVNLIWYLPRQPNGKITSFKISVKHARSGIVVKDVSIRVEDILTGKLPECNENSESFLWSTTSPSPTPGRVTPPSRTTYSSSILARSKISSVWKEPISFVVTHLRPYTTYLFEVSAVTTEAGYIDSTIVRTPESVPEGPPQNCVTGNVTGKSFSISWDPPAIVTGKFSYRVELYGPLGRILDNSTKDLKFAFTNLTPFTMYDVCVAAETSAGIGPKSNLSIFTPPDGAVFDLQPVEVEATQIRITWKKPRQPNGIINQYRVKVQVSETGVILENTLLTGRDEFIKDPIAPDMVNKVEPMVGLYEGSAEMSSDLESLASFMYNSHPNNNFPVRNRAEDQNSPVVTTRNQYITDIAAEQLSYVIRRLVPFTEHMISVSAFTIMGEGPPTVLHIRTREQGLKKYARYKMRVAASTHVGESSLSEENDIFVRTPEDEPESSPQDVDIIDVTANEIMLRWSPPEKPNGIIVAYEVLYENMDTLFTKNTSTTSIILRGLKPYTLYNISVRSYTRFGHGNQSSSFLSVRTSETAPDTPPQDFSVKQLSGVTVKLSWQPPLEPNGIILYYTVYVWDRSSLKTINVTETTLELSDLDYNVEYSAYVTASTRFGDGKTRSSIINFRTPEGAPSDPPRNVHYANLSSSSIILFWTPPSKNNGIIQYYSVYYRNSSGTFMQNFTLHEVTIDFDNLTVSAIIDKLAIFSYYTFWLTASTSVGNGNKSSDIVQVYTDQDIPEGFVGNLTCESISSTTVNVSWVPPSQPNGLVFYYVSLSSQQTPRHGRPLLVTYERSMYFDNLEKYTDYILKVTPATEKGFSDTYTAQLHIKTEEDVPLAPPQNLTLINYTSDFVWLKWSPSPLPGGIVKVYSFKIHEHETDTIIYKVKASTSAGEGDESTCNVSTLPEAVPSVPTNIAFSNVQSTSATLTWIRPDSILGYFQNYKIITQLRAQKCKEWESEECIEYQKIQYLYEADLTEETIHGLKKFRWYRFQVAASTNAGYGNATNWISIQTLPGPPDGPPENVHVVATSPFSINISWSEPAVITGPTFYLIDVKSVDNDDFNISFIKSNEENKTIEIKDLKVFTRYSVVITAFTGNVSTAYIEGKSSAEVMVTTLESAPKDPPNNMTFQKLPDEVTKFQLTFLPPSQPNGNIQVYQALVYREDDPTAVQIHNLSIIQKTDTSVIAMLEGLKGGHTYNISVYAINSAGAGPKAQMRITMDIKAPARPKTKPTPIYDATGKLLVTSTTITIRMPICYYNDDHGPIKNVQVLVAETGAQHDGNVTKWYDAYFNKARPYFTNEGFPNPPCTEGKTKFSGNEEIYVIGADNACMIPGNEEKICNGPLKPKKQYLIRQKQKEGGTYSPRDAEIIDTKFKLDQVITVADLELKDERLTRPISKKSFLQHVEELCTNNNLKFQEEFSELPKFLQDLSSTDADLPWNRAKNRFANIKPYNNNRVKLIADASIPGSDYINASYVSGYLCPNEFIATQGPLPGTVGDFWRMVWETRAKTLVMLTQCFEKGRIRCHQYWPEDNKPVTIFGDIVITKLMEDVQIDWTIRDLKIERAQYIFLHQCILDLLSNKGGNQPICFVNYSALQKMDSLDAMEGDVELEWEETTM
ncbi:Phosphotidylinositol phosphatase PTPRQ, partial [Tupaia chinensis]